MPYEDELKLSFESMSFSYGYGDVFEFPSEKAAQLITVMSSMRIMSPTLSTHPGHG